MVLVVFSGTLFNSGGRGFAHAKLKVARGPRDGNPPGNIRVEQLPLYFTLHTSIPLLHRLVTLLLFILSIALGTGVRAQDFTRADTLRGSLSPERSYDVSYYELYVDIDPREKLIEGRVEMDYTVTEPLERLQLDLYENLDVDAIRQNGKRLDYDRIGNAIMIDLPARQDTGTRHRLTVHYGGSPWEAKNPPWDGGFVWALDYKNRYWTGVACEGDGASLWWPNKDHLSDEPDSMLISVTVPEKLVAVANGNLRKKWEPTDGKQRYDWFVSYPINNYNVSINVGHYVHFEDTYESFDGEELALDYYVIDYNLPKAKKQFEQVTPMLKAYEHYLGKYPFWEDGFALIETYYLGMEHQSGIAYGNRYMRGYLGGLIPEDMDWDYIIVHEAGHEYFGNAVSVADHAEMWIHESFTTYLEALYVEYHYDEERSIEYLMSQLPFVKNEEPMLGPLGVNFTGFETSDYYYKGAWMLHTLRHVVNDDPLFLGGLRSFYQDHKYDIVSTEETVAYFSEFFGRDLGPFFDQYLRYEDVPVLELRTRGGQVDYRLATDTELTMPLAILLDGERVRIEAGPEWQPLAPGYTPEDVMVDKERFLVEREVVAEEDTN